MQHYFRSTLGVNAQLLRKVIEFQQTNIILLSREHNLFCELKDQGEGLQSEEQKETSKFALARPATSLDLHTEEVKWRLRKLTRKFD